MAFSIKRRLSCSYTHDYNELPLLVHGACGHDLTVYVNTSTGKVTTYCYDCERWANAPAAVIIDIIGHWVEYYPKALDKTFGLH